MCLISPDFSRLSTHIVITGCKLAANCLYFFCLLPFIILSPTHCPLAFKRPSRRPLALLRDIKPRRLAVPQTTSLFLPPSSPGVPQSQHEYATADCFDLVKQKVFQRKCSVDGDKLTVGRNRHFLAPTQVWTHSYHTSNRKNTLIRVKVLIQLFYFVRSTIFTF